MNDHINKKLAIFLEKLQMNSDIIEFQRLQDHLLKDKEIRESIKKIHHLNKYDIAYKEQKQKLFQNQDYKKYLKQSQEFTYWTYEMSSKLKELTGSESHENH